MKLTDMYLKTLNTNASARKLLLVNFIHEPLGESVYRALRAFAWDVVHLEDITSPGAASCPPKNEWNRIAWAERKKGFESMYMQEGKGYLSTEISPLLLTVDRVFLRPQPVADVMGYTGRLLDLADHALEGLDTDTPMLFLSTPHFPRDIALALSAQRRGHRVLTLRSSLVEGHIWIAELDGVEVSSLGLSSGAESFRYQLGTGTSTRLALSKAQNAALSSPATFSTKRILLNTLKRLARLLLPDAMNRSLKIQPIRRHEFHYWAHLGRAEMTLVRFQHRVNVRKLKSILRKNEKRALPAKYVYVPLHFQPERSTDPEAGMFRNQLLLVKQVSDFCSRYAELDLSVVVREHPRQNNGDIRQFLYRDRSFYDQLLTIPRVQVVGSDIDSSDIIKGSNLVVTANGSSAWESASMGVPSITASVTWHSGCDATPSLRRTEDFNEVAFKLVRWSQSQVFDAREKFLDQPSFLFCGAISKKHVPVGEALDAFASEMATNISDALSTDVSAWIPVAPYGMSRP